MTRRVWNVLPILGGLNAVTKKYGWTNIVKIMQNGQQFEYLK